MIFPKCHDYYITIYLISLLLLIKTSMLSKIKQTIANQNPLALRNNRLLSLLKIQSMKKQA